MSRWWRAYDEAVDDPKLILLSDRQHRAWFNLCCIGSQNGGTLPALSVIAVKLRMKPDKAKHAVAELVALHLVDDLGDGRFAMHNWDARQFKSDVTDPTNAARQQRFRDRHGNGRNTVTHTVTVKLPETEADTETDQKVQTARKRAARLPDDWLPSEPDLEYARSHGLDGNDTRTEIEKFRNHWHAKGGRDACKVDWPATWRNWVLNAVKFNGKRTTKQPLAELAFELADEARERERALGLHRSDDAFGGN